MNSFLLKESFFSINSAKKLTFQFKIFSPANCQAPKNNELPILDFYRLRFFLDIVSITIGSKRAPLSTIMTLVLPSS